MCKTVVRSALPFFLLVLFFFFFFLHGIPARLDGMLQSVHLQLHFCCHHNPTPVSVRVSG